MRSYLILTGLLLLSMVASPVFGLWLVEIEPYVTGTCCRSGTYFYLLGAAPGATNSFEDDHDITLPPAPPGTGYVYCYFAIDDPLVSRVSRDIRDEYADTLFWDFRFQWGGGGSFESYGIEWDPTELPDEGEFRIAIQLDTAHVLLRTADQPKDSIIWEFADDMREVTEVNVSAPAVYFSHPVIRYVRNPESTEETPTTPQTLTLSTHPNPFNSTVAIDAPEGYAMTITDTEGRKVADLGTGSTSWTPEKYLPSGIYIVKAEGDGGMVTQRIVYMK